MYPQVEYSSLKEDNFEDDVDFADVDAAFVEEQSEKRRLKLSFALKWIAWGLIWTGIALSLTEKHNNGQYQIHSSSASRLSYFAVPSTTFGFISFVLTCFLLRDYTNSSRILAKRIMLYSGVNTVLSILMIVVCKNHVYNELILRKFMNSEAENPNIDDALKDFYQQNHLSIWREYSYYFMIFGTGYGFLSEVVTFITALQKIKRDNSTQETEEISLDVPLETQPHSNLNFVSSSNSPSVQVAPTPMYIVFQPMNLDSTFNQQPMAQYQLYPISNQF